MNVACLSATALLLTNTLAASAQDVSITHEPLSALIEEAQKNNPQLTAAQHDWRAATHVAQQVTTLPDPQFTVQEFSVGSPRPFAGFSNSNFAYIGFGVSQQLPYPGKLRLKGLVAEREAGTRQAQTDELQASIAEQVKLTYFHLGYLQQTLTVLERAGVTLKQLTGAELSRYRVGGGSQSEVLKSQLEHTKLVREITMRHAEMAQYEADLKQLLHRPQSSPDIVADDLKLNMLAYTAPELLAAVQRRNPAVLSDRAALKKQDAQLQSVKRAGKPDFNIGYMFQETGSQYRDYYMLTFNVSLPRRRRVNAEMAQAAETLDKAESSLNAQLQQQLSEAKKQYVAASSDAELLTEYRDGLIPQAQSILRANLAAYQSATIELSSVLLSLNDELDLQRDSAQALLDHEIAIAHLENLTGESLQ